MAEIIAEGADTPFPAIIDKRAISEPDRMYAAFVEAIVDEEVQLRKVSFAQYANAVNRFAWWLEQTLGKGGETQQTLAYIGPSDLRHAIVTMGAVKAGYVALLCSPQNAPIANQKLMRETGCDTLLTASDFPPSDAIYAAIDKLQPTKRHQVASLKHWLDDKVVDVYPIDFTISDKPDRPYVILHSSGSTGYPTPITYSLAGIASLRVYAKPTEMLPELPPNTITDVWSGSCHFLGFPAFHMVGTMSLSIAPVFWNMTMIMGLATEPGSTRVANLVHKLDICQASLLPPMLLQQISRNPEQLQTLAGLRHVLWCGAPLNSIEIASKLKAVTKIYAAYGATECGPFPLQMLDQENHEYMAFSPMIGYSMRPFTDGLYEFVLEKTPELQATQFTFFNFPHLTEWRTKDLFSKHPTEPGLWKYQGRVDDVVVTPSSVKVPAPELELIINGHPKVSAALFVGSDRPRPAWLIEAGEPPATAQEAAALTEELWPTIQRINDSHWTAARVARDDIVYTRPGRPMARAPKGSVQRKLTYELYQTELAALA